MHPTDFRVTRTQKLKLVFVEYLWPKRFSKLLFLQPFVFVPGKTTRSAKKALK